MDFFATLLFVFHFFIFSVGSEGFSQLAKLIKIEIGYTMLHACQSVCLLASLLFLFHTIPNGVFTTPPAPLKNTNTRYIFGPRLYLLIPAGGECIIRLQRFAVVQPVDGIDR